MNDVSMLKFYKCPKCESKFYTSFKLIDGRQHFNCDNCGFDHAEPVNLLNHLSRDALYKEACDHFNGVVSDRVELVASVETSTTDELLKDILAELKKVNNFIYRHEQNNIRAEDAMYKAAMKSIEDMKKLEDDCVGLCEVESDEHV